MFHHFQLCGLVGRARTSPLSCRQLEEVVKQLKEEEDEEESSSLTGFLDSPEGNLHAKC